MDAYELADTLNECIDDGSTDLYCVCHAAKMLRQQADRIKRKQELIKEQTALLVKQNNRIAELSKNVDELEELLKTPQIKELSDEEIEDLIDNWDFGLDISPKHHMFLLCKTILKKASEK